MKLKQVQELSKNIEPQITELIDLKIENDMKEVISKIENSERSYFNKIEQFQNQNQSEFKRLEDKIGMIIWALGILIALIITLKIFS